MRNPVTYIDIEKTSKKISQFMGRQGLSPTVWEEGTKNPFEIYAHAIAHYFIRNGISRRYVAVVRGPRDYWYSVKLKSFKPNVDFYLVNDGGSYLWDSLREDWYTPVRLKRSLAVLSLADMLVSNVRPSYKIFNSKQ